METYKYEIHLHNGEVLYKADPLHILQKKDRNASKVYDIDGYTWHDQKWFETKKKFTKNRCLFMKFI